MGSGRGVVYEDQGVRVGYQGHRVYGRHRGNRLWEGVYVGAIAAVC